MISGIVSANEDPIIRLKVHGQRGILHEFEAVVDTGFNEFLSLPADLIDALGLAYLEEESIGLADGSLVTCAVHLGEIIWDGETTQVRIQANDGTALIGMAMMRGYELPVQAMIGGAVRLAKMDSVNSVSSSEGSEF